MTTTTTTTKTEPIFLAFIAVLRAAYVAYSSTIFKDNRHRRIGIRILGGGVAQVQKLVEKPAWGAVFD
uniref:Uncharacterized protein n=1 Tax=Romanomermis culicivorax TaxID=13658 RepID=A0A915K169_ROMCU